jgi:HlyD family secretion protein
MGHAARVVSIAMLALALAGCGGPRPYVRASGMVEMDEIDVASLEGGRIVRLSADEGDSVGTGDTLVVLQRGELAAQVVTQIAQAGRAAAQSLEVTAGPRSEEVRIARADLASANAQLALAEKQLARAQELLEGHVIAQADLDRAHSERDAALAKRDAAQQRATMLEAGNRREEVTAAREAASAARGQLAAARSRLGELVLTAPSHGVVLLRNFEAGELVMAGQPVVTLGDPDSLWVRVYVGAPEIGRVRLGARAEVIATGFGSRTFPGRVVFIATQAEFTPRAALTEEERANLVFAVRIAVEPTGGALKPGLPVEVRIAASGAPTREAGR